MCKLYLGWKSIWRANLVKEYM